ncbi:HYPOTHETICAL PROTEIN MCJ_002460 [Mesomycoplasma conjunctivae]|uniref:Uncharacterized protein n=1 Tax=Mesomycoplasma conjunctivae (strain ATCC 25834 / NCTC 10147 / HRC/581) TaxID=572263 RepID=C5J645_MESCH|nr:hypothetical protein [Mesomycoplasma conjunctivae]CAT04937.1 HYPOTHETICAL PROTEIN MCJ_002460 [Mesomycoplasma conjunctivae]
MSIELDSLNLLKELDFNDFELENNSIELARKKMTITTYVCIVKSIPAL